MLRTILNNRFFLWIILAIPAIGLLNAYYIGAMDAMTLLHPTGEFSVRLMVIAMLIGPLVDIFGRKKWLVWLQNRRRYFGVAAFGYALIHLIFYIVDMGTIADILAEADVPGIWTGYVSFILMMIAAIISNDRSMRWLKLAWKKIQQLAYPAALLAAAHWVLLEWEYMPAIVHFGPLLLANIVRIFMLNGKRK